MESYPPGDALPPPPQRATPARKGARRGAGAGSPRPHRPHPGHTGRGAQAAHSRGRAAGGGTVPDTRRPTQRWQATPPGDGPPPTPPHAAPTGHAGQGDSVGPPHPHTRAHGTWVADPNSPLNGRAVGEGTAPDPRRPSQWWKARTPPGDALPPLPQRATPACKGARCGAGAGSPRPHRPHTGHTGRGTLAARSRERAAGGGTAPDTRRPSQQWQATPPRDGPPPPPRHAALTGHAGQGDSVGPPHPHTCAHSTWVADPNSPPRGRAVGGGTAPDLRRAPQWWKASPPGTPFRHPHSEQRRPARVHAVGLVLGPHARTDRTRDTRVAEPWLPTLEDGESGEGQCLTSDAPHHGERRPPPGTLFRHPHSEQRRPARAHAVGPVLGPHARTDRTRDTWVTEPWLPAPEDERPGEGQRLAPDAPRNAGKRPPRGRPSTTPTPSNAPTHQRTSHGTSAPHPLLLGTATQQWWNPRHHADTPPISDAGQSTRGHQGAGTQRRRSRPPTRGRGHGIRPGGSTRAPHGRRARGTCAAGGQRTRDLPRVETGPLHRRRLVPQTAPPARHR